MFVVQTVTPFKQRAPSVPSLMQRCSVSVGSTVHRDTLQPGNRPLPENVPANCTKARRFFVSFPYFPSLQVKVRLMSLFL